MVGRWSTVLLILMVLCGGVYGASIADDQRLATLASKMLNLTKDLGNADYAMDCGPAAEVLNMRPTGIRSTSYCVLNFSGRTIIGTYDDATVTNIEQLMMRVYNDTQFYAHVPINGIKPSACDGKGINGFEECTGAITVKSGLPAMYVYIYRDDLATGSMYMLISDSPISSVRNTKTFFGAIEEFFTGWFS
jgi:hypothetical protein